MEEKIRKSKFIDTNPVSYVDKDGIVRIKHNEDKNKSDTPKEKSS